jgi:hypothetical protein
MPPGLSMTRAFARVALDVRARVAAVDEDEIERFGMGRLVEGLAVAVQLADARLDVCARVVEDPGLGTAHFAQRRLCPVSHGSNLKSARRSGASLRVVAVASRSALRANKYAVLSVHVPNSKITRFFFAGVQRIHVSRSLMPPSMFTPAMKVISVSRVGPRASGLNTGSTFRGWTVGIGHHPKSPRFSYLARDLSNPCARGGDAEHAEHNNCGRLHRQTLATRTLRRHRITIDAPWLAASLARFLMGMARRR